ncbi:MAG TPA: cysteine desulfurase family protein [Rhizomicrobium sp.]|jgi:cysteine desulfurase|nr:cysteine desulfurase family protein [Rhizomicrobium sp.]
MIYLDHNATSPLRPEARAAMERALAIGGNPSSVHAAGRAARKLIEDAREQVAVFAGAKPAEVIFTSGGAEANALALRGAVAGDAVKRLFVAATAHESVRAVAAALAETGLTVIEIPVNESGRIEPDHLRELLANGEGRALVSLIFANNETGVIEDVAHLSASLREIAPDALLHVDAVSCGYSPVRFSAWGADYLSLSAHKIGGPQGVGALIAKDGSPLDALFNGAQERRYRAGTENVSGIAGFGAAAQAVQARFDEEREHVALARRYFESELHRLEPNATIFSEHEIRQPHVCCFAIPQLRAENTLMALDLDGICLSSGAACSSGKVSPSHVLAAMGVEESLSRCALRVSFGPENTLMDVDAVFASLQRLIGRKLAVA